MARQFNGSSQALYAAIDLSSYAQASISFWLWLDSYASDPRVAIEYHTAYEQGGFILSPQHSGVMIFGFATGALSAKYWQDNFTGPSAAAWHHYLLTFNRATPVNTAYVDGAPRSLSTNAHNAATYGNFGNSNLNLMARNHATFWDPGRMAEVALWGGVILTAREALALSSGISPTEVGPVPLAYWPLLGDTPEPDYGGLRKSASLQGTPTIVAHPPTRPFMRPGYSYSG